MLMYAVVAAAAAAVVCMGQKEAAASKKILRRRRRGRIPRVLQILCRNGHCSMGCSWERACAPSVLRGNLIPTPT
jgi:hypothetical protein